MKAKIFIYSFFWQTGHLNTWSATNSQKECYFTVLSFLRFWDDMSKGTKPDSWAYQLSLQALVHIWYGSKKIWGDKNW
jgi:hypothetical protein